MYLTSGICHASHPTCAIPKQEMNWTTWLPEHNCVKEEHAWLCVADVQTKFSEPESVETLQNSVTTDTIFLLWTVVMPESTSTSKPVTTQLIKLQQYHPRAHLILGYRKSLCFAPHGNFELNVPRSIHSLIELCTKKEQDSVHKSKDFLQFFPLIFL